LNIYTREFDSGKVVLGGNRSGGAENAWSMYVLFASPSDSPPDPLGSLEVSASTTGDNQDSDGYAVTVGGSTSKEIDPNGSATFSGLNEGNHQVELTGLKANCSVGGPNPRTVSVTAGNPASTSFSVSCTSSGGGGGDLQAVEIPNQSDFTDRGKVLDGGACGEWDWWLQGPSSAVNHEGTTYLYYVGMDGDRQAGPCEDANGDERNRHTGVATSTDNRTFSKAGSNPQIIHQPNGDQDFTTGEGGTLFGGSPGVVDGTFVLYVGGMEEYETERVDNDVVYYESNDGISFSEKTDVGDHNGLAAYDDENFPIGAVEIDGSYYVYYTGQGGGDTDWSLQAINGSAPDADMTASSQKISGPGNNNVKGKSGGAIRKGEDTVMITTQPCYGGCKTKVWTASTSDPTSFTHQETWDWGTTVSEPHLFLDRDAGEWLLFYRYSPDGGSTSNNEIHLKTAPVSYEN
jgi:hypothetical protein